MKIRWIYSDDDPDGVLYYCRAKSDIVIGLMGREEVVVELPPDAMSIGFVFEKGFRGLVDWSILGGRSGYEYTVYASTNTFILSDEERAISDEKRAARLERWSGAVGADESAVAAAARQQVYWRNNSKYPMSSLLDSTQWFDGMGFKHLKPGESLVTTLPEGAERLTVMGGLVTGEGFKGRLLRLLSGCPASGMIACMIADEQRP